jgi:nitroimidazol reductase NimA-like FMN-containing flavoprotein (pyridoxamine 5'-phosphate oxidase superfamily)
MSTSDNTITPSKLAPSERTRVRRIAENAHYETSLLYQIIDDAYLCYVAFQDDKGTHCIPTACWREGDHLYIHGSNAGRLTKVLMAGAQACVSITHLDGLVLARAAFNHSMNYRSAMIYGVFQRVEGEAQKAASIKAFMHKIAPGREDHARPGSQAELAGTTFMRIALNEAACKMRTGGPKDDEEDMQREVWAGVLPMSTRHDAPIVDEQNIAGTPDYVKNWQTKT